MDERDIAKDVDVDVVAADLAGARPVLYSPQELALVDAMTVRERADEVAAQVLAVPGRVSLGEGTGVAGASGTRTRSG